MKRMRLSPAVMGLTFIGLCVITALAIHVANEEPRRRMLKMEERTPINRLTIQQDPSEALSVPLGGPTGVDPSLAAPRPATRPALFNSDRDVLLLHGPDGASSRPK